MCSVRVIASFTKKDRCIRVNGGSQEEGHGLLLIKIGRELYQVIS